MSRKYPWFAVGASPRLARPLLRDVSHHPVGEGLAPPTGFRNFPVNAGILPCEAAHQVVASYGRHGHRRAALCGRPSPVARRFPPSRRGGLAPPAGFRNFSGQRWNFVLRVGAPYGCRGHRRTGGSGDPPLRGNFGPRRCDGCRSHGTAPVPPELYEVLKLP